MRIIWKDFQKYWYLNSISSTTGLGLGLVSVLLFNVFMRDFVMQESLEITE